MVTLSDIDTLAKTIWGEARGEGEEGMICVAFTVLNRMKDRRWPDSAAEVCTQRWQYSCWNSNDPNLPRLKALDVKDALFLKCYAIAAGVLAGMIAPDKPAHYATHYFNWKQIDWPKGWGKKAAYDDLYRVGNHHFWNERA